MDKQKVANQALLSNGQKSATPSLNTNSTATARQISEAASYPGTIDSDAGGDLPSGRSAELVDGAGVESNESASAVLFIAVLAGCVSPMLFGYTIGFTSPAQDTMDGNPSGSAKPPADLVVFSQAEFSWYASLLNIGAVLGAFSGSPLSNRFGPKKTLVLTAVPHIIGWVGSGLLSDAILLIVLRILIGWGVGVGSAVTPVYIGEVSTTGLRGALGAANQLSVTFGIFFANLVGAYVFIAESDGENFCQWRYICFLGGACALLLGIVSFLPESPKWLAGQGREQDCRTALQRLRKGDSSEEADRILAEMTVQEEAGAPASMQRQSSPTASLGTYKKSMIVGIGLCVFQQMGGVNAVMMYTDDICKSAGVTNYKSAGMLVMGLQVVLTGVSCMLMERAGRRGLLLFGSFCMTLAHLALAYYFLAADEKGMWGPSWLAMGGLGVFILGFSLALGPIPWLILAEIFPTEVRSSACSIATAVNWSCSFIVTLVFKDLESAITKEGTFLLFAIVCALCFMFVLILVPETKGKNVQEVLAMLEGRQIRQTTGGSARSWNSFGTRGMSLQPPRTQETEEA